MKSRVDLHLHSTASDGLLTPTQLVRAAQAKGLQAIALTDHDTVDGIEEANEAAQGSGVTVIPGVEISTDVPGIQELHILGYHINPQHSELRERLTELTHSRLGRARQTLDRLAQAGCPLSWDHLRTLAKGGVIGRPHIAQALVDARYVDSVNDAFRRYLGRGASAYVQRKKLTPKQAIAMIRSAGGAPVLAHPSRLLEHIPRLVGYGLAGIEVYYPGYPQTESRFLANLARKHKLIATGGSDFHGPGITQASDLGVVDVPWSAVDELCAYLQSRAPSAHTLAPNAAG
jgi:predicted metal-dependent phosphoesterase TrpH